MSRTLTSASALAVALALAAWATSAAPSGPPPDAPPLAEANASPAPDDPIPAPNFELPTGSGDAFQLSDHRGEVVVLNLWATWCPPCRHEIPDFIELQDELGSQGLTVVGVSLDDDGWDAVRPFAEEMGISYTVAVDDGTVEALYGPTATLPTTFVIDREGNVRHYIPGMILGDDLAPLLRPLLDETASS